MQTAIVRSRERPISHVGSAPLSRRGLFNGPGVGFVCLLSCICYPATCSRYRLWQRQCRCPKAHAMVFTYMTISCPQPALPILPGLPYPASGVTSCILYRGRGRGQGLGSGDAPHWQSSAHSQYATYLWLVTLSRRLIVSQYLGEGVEDLLVCSGNM